MATTLSLTLNVTDLARSLAAYRALGFRVVETWKDEKKRPTYVMLSLGKVEVGLAAIASNDDADFRAWVSTPLGAGVVIELSVPDVDAVLPKARRSGFIVESGPTDRPYGRVLTLNDPDGYTLAFYGRVKPKRASKKAKAARPPAKKRR